MRGPSLLDLRISFPQHLDAHGSQLKPRFKSEAAAVREAERPNLRLKATKVMDQKKAWLIRLRG